MRSPPSPVQVPNAKVYQLSVDFNSVADAVTVPALCLQNIWQKAEELLNSSGSVVSAPGHSEQAKMVLSRSGNHSHLVLPCKSGRYKCESECANFKSFAICSHVVAVAQLNKSSRSSPCNFTQLALHDMPSGHGRKGARAPQKRKMNQLPHVLIVCHVPVQWCDFNHTILYGISNSNTSVDRQ